ncbi:MAG: dTMP kinase [Thermoplasmata archaeon]|nr:dTMP kinase [Thermoplasmata archaeon]
MNTRRARFIVIEGIDASGKATQAQYLLKWFSSLGLSASFHELPGESPAGNIIRRFLKGEVMIESPEELALLYASDRYHLLPTLQEELERYDVVLFDRYTPSNQAYQGARFSRGERRENFIKWIDYVESPLPQPDLILFLDVPSEITAELIKKRGEADRNESYVEFQREVYSIYRELSDGEGWVKIKCVVGGKILPPDKIAERIKRELLKRFPSTFSSDL